MALASVSVFEAICASQGNILYGHLNKVLTKVLCLGWGLHRRDARDGEAGHGLESLTLHFAETVILSKLIVFASGFLCY